jgi:signal transduction histidine kinase
MNAAADVAAGRSAAGRDGRVLLLALTAKDAVTTQALLRDAAIDVEIGASFDALLHELGRGAAAVAVAEEHLTDDHSAQLGAALQRQPAWSDLPVLVLARQGANSAAVAEALRRFGNVTLLERPLRIATLVSAVRTAVRARARQYQIREHLEQRERAAEALRAADRRKDEFLATLGHELRNPLAPLLTGLHLLRLVEERDPRIDQIADLMERQVTHLVRLVDDLLEVSRITRGTIEMRSEPLDLVALVGAAIETTRPMFEASRHELAVDLPNEKIGVRGDSVRLTQVLTNLLTNAAKYTNTAGRVAVGVRRADDKAIIAVRDNGIGIPASHLDSVFEMFMQVDRSSRRSQGGLGIGLTLVRSIVEMHGGTVAARSEGIGRCSEFVVTLPALAAGAAPAHSAAKLEPFPARRVLIVDDNRDAADTLGSLLRHLGATVAVEYGGVAALAALGRFKPEAVLLDIGMPGMDGYEVARRIRAEGDGNVPQLIALTGWGQDQDYRRSQLAGFDHHLVKPPNIQRLRSLLRGV